jgi:hypothetical protein
MSIWKALGVSALLQLYDGLVTRTRFMNLGWLAWSNPVAVWWGFLSFVGAGNIAVLLRLHHHYRKASTDRRNRDIAFEPLLFLSTTYVLGCAFRSVLPRADVQRICLFDTWLSSVFVGRSVATLAEICFILQWAIVLRELARVSGVESVRNLATAIVPLIVVAECCSWYAVITTDFLGNILENSLWTATFILIALALLGLMTRFRGSIQLALAGAAVGIAGYVVFMSSVDVPMYYARWEVDLASQKPLLGFLTGLHDVSTRWVVTHDFAHWNDEMAWMALYFSGAAWSSLALAAFGLVRHRVPSYCVGALPMPMKRPIAVPAPLAVRIRAQ